jgi:hypothetical protein
MKRTKTPFGTGMELSLLATRMGLMLAEANMVILMRLWGLAGVWNVTPHENRRMVREKHDAATEATVAATRAAMRGGSAAAVANAALKPVRRRTKSNLRRLALRGPGAPRP